MCCREDKQAEVSRSLARAQAEMQGVTPTYDALFQAMCLNAKFQVRPGQLPPQRLAKPFVASKFTPSA